MDVQIIDGREPSRKSLSTSVRSSTGGAEGKCPARHRYPLEEDIAFLNRYGIGYPALYAAQSRANAFKIPAHQVLIAGGVITETDYFYCVALELGLEFTPETRADQPYFFEIPTPDDLNRGNPPIFNGA